MGVRYQRKLSYQAMDRWKFFVPLSFLLHIIIMLSIDIKLSMPIPDKRKPNKSITLILQAAPLPIKPPPVANNAPKPILAKVEPEKTLPAPVVAKKVPRPVVVAKTPPPTNMVRQRYIKAPPVQHLTVAKASVTKQSPVPVRRTPAPVQPARASAPVAKSNIPDNMADLPRIGIPVQPPPQPQPAVITSNMPSDMQNLPRIGIPVQATTPVQHKPAISQPQPTVAQKVPVPNVVKSVAPPTPVQPVQKSIPPVPERIADTPEPEMSIPAPPVKQVPIETSQSTPVAVNTVKQSAFQQRLESLQDNVISFMPVFPQVIRLMAQGWLKDLEEITVPPVAPTPSRAVVQSVPVENSTEQTSQENAVSQTKPEAIPEQFMSDDRFHTKEVIQGNMDKDSLLAEQQGKSGKKLGSIIFKERKNYGDITQQEESSAQNTKKPKGEGFSIPIGDCYVGSKTEVEEGQSGEHKNPINCNF